MVVQPKRDSFGRQTWRDLLPGGAAMPLCQAACHSLPWAECSCALTFPIRTRHGMSSFLQHIPDQERRKRGIGFENAGNRTGYNRRRKTGSLHVLIVGSDQLQFCDAAVGVGILSRATNKQILRFVGYRSIGKDGRCYPNAWSYEVWLRYLVAAATVVAMPEGNFLMAENILVINSANGQGERGRGRRQEAPLAIVAGSRHHADACFHQCHHRFIHGVSGQRRDWISTYREADDAETQIRAMLLQPSQSPLNARTGDVPIGITNLHEYEFRGVR